MPKSDASQGQPRGCCDFSCFFRCRKAFPGIVIDETQVAQAKEEAASGNAFSTARPSLNVLRITRSRRMLMRSVTAVKVGQYGRNCKTAKAAAAVSIGETDSMEPSIETTACLALSPAPFGLTPAFAAERYL